jgi:hypothetical protein
MESRDGRQWPAPLAGRVARNAHAADMAAAVVVVWGEIDRALHPIIGHRGVAALYNRSLKLASVAFPWLGSAHQGMLDAVDPSALTAALLGQTAEEGAAGAIALFSAFRELLSSLIGPSLTDRLLRSVWTDSSGDPPAQDTLP